MAAPDKSSLLSRLQELHSQPGRTWNEIAHILKEEGYEEKGKALSGNALRKRYAKLNKPDPVGRPSAASKPQSSQTERGSDFDRLQKSRMDSYSKRFEEGAALPALSPEDALAASTASLVDLNRQLLEQIEQSHRMIERLEKKIEEQEQKATHTGMDTEQPVTPRELLELLKEFARGQEMKFIEENKEYHLSRREVLQLLDEKVEDRVDSELRAMLAAEGSFSQVLSQLIDQRLKTLFSGEPISTTPHAGPGRGKKGKSHVKFSASLEERLYARARSLPGQFSRHLANALSAYLAAVEEKKRID
jgi:hypothetical protein